MENPALNRHSNFKEGDYWISLNREIYFILEVQTTKITYFPLKIVHVRSREEVLANRSGNLGIHTTLGPDKLVLKLSADHPKVQAALSHR